MSAVVPDTHKAKAFAAMTPPSTPPEDNTSLELGDRGLGPKDLAASSPPAAPDGGLQAWLQVLGAFIVYFNTWGLMISFAVFQSYYENHLLEDLTPSAISWIGTVQVFFLIEVGVITGPLCDQGYLRHILAAGSVLLALGLMMTSLAREYYGVFLSFGVCAGLGMGCLFFPSITSISTYFSKKRGLASGIAASGSGFGSIVYPIVFRELIPRVSFPWAVRTIALIVLATNIIPLVVLRPLWLPSGKRKLVDKTVVKDRIYVFWSLMNVLGWIGLQAPLFYASVFAQSVVGLSQPDAFYMAAIAGAGSIPGRVVSALASDKFGALFAYPAGMAMASIVSFAWMGVTTYGGLVAVVFLYGFAYGGMSSLPSAAIAELSSDRSTLGTRIGISFAFAGLAMLVGPPVAGAIEQTEAGYPGVFGFSGAMMAAGSAFTLYAAIMKQRQRRALVYAS